MAELLCPALESTNGARGKKQTAHLEAARWREFPPEKGGQLMSHPYTQSPTALLCVRSRHGKLGFNDENSILSHNLSAYQDV